MRALALAAAVAALVVAPAVADAQGDAGAGKAVYALKCAGCHGEKGDGKGPAAELLLPAPRDFTAGIYKIRTTSNKTPTDQDLFRIISDGMPGTSMPAWSVLPEKDRWNLVAYVKTFAGDKLKEAPKKVELPKEVASSEASIKRGKEMYEAIECHKCHGTEGRADGPSRARRSPRAGKRSRRGGQTTLSRSASRSVRVCRPGYRPPPPGLALSLPKVRPGRTGSSPNMNSNPRRKPSSRPKRRPTSSWSRSSMSRSGRTKRAAASSRLSARPG